MKNQILTFAEDPRGNSEEILRKAGKFVWRHKGKIAICIVATVATGGTAPVIAASMGSAGLLGAAGTGTAISSLTGCALTSASLASASITGTMAGGIATIAGTGGILGTAAGTVIDKLTNKKK